MAIGGLAWGPSSQSSPVGRRGKASRPYPFDVPAARALSQSSPEGERCNVVALEGIGGDGHPQEVPLREGSAGFDGRWWLSGGPSSQSSPVGDPCVTLDLPRAAVRGIGRGDSRIAPTGEETPPAPLGNHEGCPYMDDPSVSSEVVQRSPWGEEVRVPGPTPSTRLRRVPSLSLPQRGRGLRRGLSHCACIGVVLPFRVLIFRWTLGMLRLRPPTEGGRP